MFRTCICLQILEQISVYMRYIESAYLNQYRIKLFCDITMINIVMLFYLKEGDDSFPKDKDGSIIFSDIDYVETWKVKYFQWIFTRSMVIKLIITQL